MAVIIDDEAAVVQPLRVLTDGVDLSGITQDVRRAAADFAATSVVVDGQSYPLATGDYVAVDTGTEFVKVRIGDGKIFVTVSSAFKYGTYYNLADAGAINSVIVNGNSVHIGQGPRHRVEILD